MGSQQSAPEIPDSAPGSILSTPTQGLPLGSTEAKRSTTPHVGRGSTKRAPRPTKSAHIVTGRDTRLLSFFCFTLNSRGQLRTPSQAQHLCQVAQMQIPSHPGGLSSKPTRSPPKAPLNKRTQHLRNAANTQSSVCLIRSRKAHGARMLARRARQSLSNTVSRGLSPSRILVWQPQPHPGPVTSLLRPR